MKILMTACMNMFLIRNIVVPLCNQTVYELIYAEAENH